MSRTFSNEQKSKLTRVINECCGVMNEIETLTDGMNDTIRSVASEMEIKPSILKKAVKIAHKASLGQTNKDHEDLNEILETVGRTL